VAADETEFGTELRGYRKDDVDRALSDLRRELIKANADRAEMAGSVKHLQTRLDDLQTELEEAGTPTYAGLGSKLEQTLRLAEEQATALVSKADIDAEELRSSSTGEARRLLADARERADALL
jgi:cell division septum initiation protein DivIVA